ncbi:hypothetical protein DRO69_02710 [Candidatus Bathyarchaeota archaeon]|nr:MAG: hypothetical protein DRO69_02710 [Candidatus Bathyarchaeota archaeon]
MTSKTKCLIIGIDGLDADLLSHFKDQLPNFNKLMQKSSSIRMTSVFPPDSPTAWASIYTGLNPAKHGVVSFKDSRTRSKVGEYLDYVGNIVGRAFWDYAGRHNKKCCIIFPHLAYPPWPINGIMVSRTTEVDLRKFDLKTYPTNIPLGCNPAEVMPITSFPSNPYQIIQPTKKLILNEVKLGLRFLNNYDWNLFFIYFSSLDNIQHVFWNELENYGGDKKYKSTIFNFYRFYDKYVIGKFLKYIDENTVFIVLSDHGHGLRPCKLVNINEFLARAGLLKVKIKRHNFYDPSYTMEFVKKKTTKIISEKRIIAKMASKFLSLFPQALGIYTVSSPIDWENTVAYLADCSAGLKAYSYAGIKVQQGLSPSLYEKTRQSIVNMLKQIKNPFSSEKIVEWVMKREDLYKGPYLSKYPDIIFKLKDEWGVGWEVGDSLYGKSISHKLFPGNHRQESAVLIAYHPSREFLQLRQPTLTDVAPTILSLLGIDNYNLHTFDGENILRYNSQT